MVSTISISFRFLLSLKIQSTEELLRWANFDADYPQGGHCMPVHTVGIKYLFFHFLPTYPTYLASAVVHIRDSWRQKVLFSSP
jgi:hypothetical protein